MNKRMETKNHALPENLETKLEEVPAKITDNIKFKVILYIYEKSKHDISEFDQAKEYFIEQIEKISPIAYHRQTGELYYEIKGKTLRKKFGTRFAYSPELKSNTKQSTHGYITIQKPSIPENLKKRFSSIQVVYK